MIGEREKKTNFRFRNVEGFDTCIIATDVDYDSEDVIFTGWLNKLNIHQFNMINRSEYGRGTVFEQDFVDYIGIKCYIPTSGQCFIKCNNHLTGKE